MWKKFSDEWFTYYVNIYTGEKKFRLDKGDVEYLDEFDLVNIDAN